MRIIDIFRINFKKLKHRTSKAMFLILPITILVTLTVVIASQVTNISKATNESIFGKIDNENTILQITKQQEENTQSFRGFQPPTEFNESDLTNIKSVSNIVDATLNYSVPVSNIYTNDLIQDKEITLNNISVLSEAMATSYTLEDFSYSDNDTVIPIILNTNTLMETYEDWGDKTTMTVNMRGLRDAGQDPMQLTPIKTKAIEYKKEDLIGKEFKVTVGGLDKVNSYEITREAGVMTFTKLNESEITELSSDRKDTINKYWEYNNLIKGNTYTFKIVGIIESESNRTSYIPTTFANRLMNDLISLEINNRRDNLDYEIVNELFSGMSYDGTELSNISGLRLPGQNNAPIMGGMNRNEPSMQTSSTKYTIPGLVIITNSEDSSTITGLNKNSNVFEESIKTSQTISIKINSNENREQIVKDINNLGYALVDINNLELFNNIQSTLSRVSNWLIIAFIALSSGVIILTMSKFVSDSSKEIGIYRAVGFTKGNILSIFLTQGIVYTLIGYVLGIGFGYILNLLSSSFISNWFNNFLNETIAKTYNIIELTNSSMFTYIDINALATISIIIFVLSIFISFIPAYKASNISPVEAIKTE